MNTSSVYVGVRYCCPGRPLKPRQERKSFVTSILYCHMNEGPRLGINPSWWGGSLWDSIHYITLGYPEHSPSDATRHAARTFLFSLVSLLPCSLCRQHLRDSLRGPFRPTDDVFSGRRQFGEYIVRLRDYTKVTHVLHPHSRWRYHSFENDVIRRLYECRKNHVWRQRLVTAVAVTALIVVLVHVRR